MRRVKPKYFKRKPAVKYSRFDSSLSSIDHEIRRLKIVLGSIIAGLIIFISILTNQWATFFSLHVNLPALPFDQIKDAGSGLLSQIDHSIPGIPAISLPEFSLKWIHLPSISVPTVHLPILPAVKMPTVSAPKLPQVHIPHVHIPKVSFSVSDVFLTVLSFFRSIFQAVMNGIFTVLHFLDPRPLIFAIVQWILRKITDGILALNTLIQPFIPLVALLRVSFDQMMLTFSDGFRSLLTILTILINNHQ